MSTDWLSEDCFKTTPVQGYYNVLLFYTSDLDGIRERLKGSIRKRCKNFMSNDWLPKESRGHKTIPVQGYYIEPRLTRTVKKGNKDEQVPMDRLYEIFEMYKSRTNKILAVGKK